MGLPIGREIVNGKDFSNYENVRQVHETSKQEMLVHFSFNSCYGCIMSDSFKILCLSGGGFLGLYTATVLAGLERRFGSPIAKHFDLIAGTSVGGILACGIAAEIPAEKIKSAFEKNGTSIFSSRPTANGPIWGFIDVCRSLFRPKYSHRALKETVDEIVGQDTRIGDLKHPLIIPTINLSKGRPQIFKTPHHPSLTEDKELKVSDVALATSAAPTFFPLAEVRHSLFVDGGLYANSPDVLALHEAEYFFKKQVPDISMLSIGTTTSQFSFAHTIGRQLGSFSWMYKQRLVNVIIASQQQSADFMMRHRLDSRYLRLDAIQSKEQELSLGLDVATLDAQKTIMALAESTLQDNINNSILNSFFE
jgi:predicted acylesterase/phospholipase RssA